ncbi:LOW QUALITY PROTEIN: mas-related G-protein coupled receptor member A-like [Alexandromys fortis]|uniref:LOW QUALITY PROTEIN: mas-related G-protein coupled receptor member A-like n=1 Tax=Alexandromys fortis TaxID=100897 RepID=UPI0021520077|nr:LOW QUALITY PROTEIN: mas-related G-protein coupled receptor member A-like [Microtus fortis]
MAGFLSLNTSASGMAVTTNPMDKTVPGSFNSRPLIPNLMIVITGLVGLTGNAAVFWFLGFRLRRNAFSVYILNLAVADFLFLFCHIIDSTLLLLKFSYPGIICLLAFNTVKMVPYIAGLSMLSAISTERCLSVLCRIWYRCRRPTNTSAVVCAAMWVLSILISILNRYFCGFLDTKYKNNNPCLASNFFTAACLIFLFVVLFLSSLTLLARLFCGAGRIKLTRLYATIMFTVLVFLLCGLPFGIHWFLLIWIKIDYGVFAYGLYLASLVLTAINSCANPVIYFFVGSFRHQLKHQTLKMVLQRALQDAPETGENGSSVPQDTTEMSNSKVEQ